MLDVGCWPAVVALARDSARLCWLGGAAGGGCDPLCEHGRLICASTLRELRAMRSNGLRVLEIGIGTLDFGNERGVALFDAWLERTGTAIEDADAAAMLPA